MSAMLNFIEILDLLGWHDSVLLEAIETGMFPVQRSLNDLIIDFRWPYRELSRPLTSEAEARGFMRSELKVFRQFSSWRQLLASLFDNGVYAWQLRRYVLNPDLLTYDEACRVLERHFESFVASCEDEDSWDEDSRDVDSIPKYCDEYVILDLYRGTAGSGLERVEVAKSVVTPSNFSPSFDMKPREMPLAPQPKLQIDAHKLVQLLEQELIRICTMSAQLGVISAHDLTGIPYRRAWMMERQGKLKVVNLLQEFQARLSWLTAKHAENPNMSQNS